MLNFGKDDIYDRNREETVRCKYYDRMERS